MRIDFSAPQVILVCPGLRTPAVEQTNVLPARTPASSSKRASLKCYDRGWDMMK